MRLTSTLLFKGALSAFLFLGINCAFGATHHHKTHHYHHPIHSHPLLALQHDQNSVCRDAKIEIGLPYAWGGTSPNSGFDCSGFSQYVYKEEGFRIPRTAAEQFASLTPVHTLEPGDLVFFRLGSYAISHVGIYLGHGKFVHSPATGQAIRVDDLYTAYWQDHYAGARRVI